MSDTPETSLKCAECGTTIRKDVAIFSAYQKDFCGPDHAFDWSAKMIEMMLSREDLDRILQWANWLEAFGVYFESWDTGTRERIEAALQGAE